MVFKISRLAGAFAGVTALTVACGGANSDRAGGAAAAEPIVLTMAQANGEPPATLVRWAEEVASQSQGTLVIEFANRWRFGEPAYEAATISDVRAGDIDVAWVGARAVDRAGVTSFQPLLAPLLIDSQDLQEAVFEAGIPDQMLAGLEGAGLVGLGILPGPMRKVLGVEHPFITPSDFDGAVVGMQDGGVAEQSLLALGASPQALPTDAELTTVDGYEQQLASIAGNDYWRVAEFVSANVNMWPRPLVMFMNADTFASLGADQQSALRDAAGAIVEGAFEDARVDDAGGVQELCDMGMTLAEATDDDLVALRQALQPVYDSIASNPENAAWLAEIETLKDEVDTPPDTAACTSSEATSTDSATAAIEATYQWTITDEIALEHGTPGDQTEAALATYPTTFTVTLEDGRWTMTPVDDTGASDHYQGTYSVVRDHIAFDWGDGLVLEFTFAIGDDGTMTLTPAPGTPDGDAFVWSSVPWTRVDD